MLQEHYQYVLVGGGLASSSAAEAIRKLDSAGSVLLVGQEVNRPYHRPPLSKEYLQRKQQRGDIVVQPPGWFSRQKIDLRSGERVAHLDTARSAILLASGTEIAFDKLLIATGASARPLDIPGATLPNVFTVRTIDDADRLHNAVDKAKAEGRTHPRGRGVAVVIGGGVLGVELAASLTELGLAVELVVADAFVWSHLVGETSGRLLSRHLELHGVHIHAGQRPSRLEGDGRVQRVVLPNGTTILCDFVVAAIGAIPNRELLHDTPITSERAILVDDHCRTNLPNIFAAGDCAAIFDPLFGKHRLIDHWDNARVTGAIAGTNMAGGNDRYTAVNYFDSQAFGLKISSWGEAKQVDRRHVRGSVNVESPDFIEIGVAADGRIAQVVSVGHLNEDRALTELVRRRVRVNGNEELLKDPKHPLSEFLE